jgi:GNAT superfamily N-acetyltransferase
MIFKVFENKEAKDFINMNILFKDILEDIYVTEWLENKLVKLYLIYNEDNILVSFALLNKLDRDVLKKHKNPFYLNYIYTFEKYRRKGYAYQLSLEIKKDLETTIFCTDDISQNLFKKAGFIFNDFDPLYKSFPIYRYP